MLHCCRSNHSRAGSGCSQVPTPGPHRAAPLRAHVPQPAAALPRVRATQGVRSACYSKVHATTSLESGVRRSLGHACECVGPTTRGAHLSAQLNGAGGTLKWCCRLLFYLFRCEISSSTHSLPFFTRQCITQYTNLMNNRLHLLKKEEEEYEHRMFPMVGTK